MLGGRLVLFNVPSSKDYISWLCLAASYLLVYKFIIKMARKGDKTAITFHDHSWTLVTVNEPTPL